MLAAPHSPDPELPDHGLTDPASPVWRDPSPTTHTRYERTAQIGVGHECWERAAPAVLRWEIKTRSGFRVTDNSPVVAGRKVTVTAGWVGVRVREPVQVVQVVDTDTRVGFSYRALPGHPVSGEEAFIVHRDGERVLLTLRSLTAPAGTQPWRALFPLLRIAQSAVRRRYFRALR